MDPSLQSKLIECLDALQQEQSVEQVLARYPQERDQLRPLLETAVRLQQFNLQPSLAAQSRSRQAFLAEAEALSAASRARPSSLVWLRRLLVPVAAMVMLFLLGAGLITVSASAVPGEPLYGPKRLAESLQLALTANATPRAELLEQFRQERIAEIRQLMADGQDAEVEFEGLIQSIEKDSWRIAGLNTRVDSATQISGPAQAGNTAVVVGRVSGGDLLATAISIVAGPSPIPQPSPTDTVVPTPTPTAEPSFTPTAKPVDNAEPQQPTTSTTDPQPDDTPTATATMTPEPEPTATATPSLVSPVGQPTPADDIGGGDGSGADNSNNNDDESSDENSNDDEENHNDASDDNSSNDGEEGDDASNENDHSGGGEEENSNDDDSSVHGSGDGDSEDNSNEEDKSGSG
jgi:hypothetical protein